MSGFSKLNLTCMSGEEIWKFIVSEPLLSYFFLRSKIEELPDCNFVAAVSVKNGTVCLRINSADFKTFTFRQKMGILVHEYLHVLLQHCTSRVKHYSGVQAKKENYAMDMSINQMIRSVWDLPEYAIYHDNPSFGFPPNLSAEQYLELINQKYPDETFSDSFGPNKGADTHDSWSSATDEDDALIKEIARSYQNSYGPNDLGETLSAHAKMAGVLENILARDANDISWDIEVRRFIHSSRSASFRRTYKRVNRRFGFPSPGLAHKYTAKVAAIVDTSSSMGNKVLEAVAGQLNKMSWQMLVDIIMCDSEVLESGIVKGFKASSSVDFRGRRDTDLQPGFDYAEKENYKAIVCFTDGFFDKDVLCAIPLLWVCIGNENFSPRTGKVIHVNWKEVSCE